MSRFVRLPFAVLLWSLLSYASQAGAFVVEDIRVEGLQRISAGTVFNYLPVKTGDEVNTGNTARIIRTLFKTGFFQDVRLEQDGNVLIVFVRERPAIAEINITGNKDLETEALLAGLKDIGLAEGQVFKRVPIARDAASMIDRMQEAPVYTVGVTQKDEAFRSMAPEVNVL